MNDEKDSAPRNPSMEIKPEKKATKPNYPALVIVGVGAAAACTALTLERCLSPQPTGGVPRINIEHIRSQRLSGYLAPVPRESAREEAPARSEINERNKPANSDPASD